MPKPATLLWKYLCRWCFPLAFLKFSKATILKNTCERLSLYLASYPAGTGWLKWRGFNVFKTFKTRSFDPVFLMLWQHAQRQLANSTVLDKHRMSFHLCTGNFSYQYWNKESVFFRCALQLSWSKLFGKLPGKNLW